MQYEGCTFQLTIVVREGETAALVYLITDASVKSKHYTDFKKDYIWRNPFTEKYGNFLFIKEMIKTEADLRHAIREARIFINKYMPQFLVIPKRGYTLVS